MNRSRWSSLQALVLFAATALTLASIAGVAQAKPWTTWATLAPDPLASDSSYAALSALPEDSLSTSEFSWLAMQRDWRRQRRDETRFDTPQAASTVTEAGIRHLERPTDKRFAKLAAQPYGALNESERSWLVVENAVHNADAGTSTGERVVGGILIAGLLGAVLAVVTIGYVFSHAWQIP